MKAQESYIDTSTTQSTAPGLFGGFSFRCLKKLKGGDSWIHSTAQRKEQSKTEFEKKNSENEFGESDTFYRRKFIRDKYVITPFYGSSRFDSNQPIPYWFWYEPKKKIKKL